MILLPRCSDHSWFTPFDSHEETSSPLEGYAHADGSSTADDQRTTPGYAFPIGGGTVPRSLTQQETVPSPTAEGEYIVATHGSNEASWLRSLVSALFGTPKSPTTCLSDTPAAAASTRHRHYRPPAPHIDVRHHHWTRQAVEKGFIPPLLITPRTTRWPTRSSSPHFPPRWNTSPCPLDCARTEGECRGNGDRPRRYRFE